MNAGVARFDSASTMVRALGRFLHGRDFPGLGMPITRATAPLANLLPAAARRAVYRTSGWWEGIQPSAVDRLDDAALARYVVGHYPRRRYPAVMVGSSNGAALHVACALQVPWLPQTLLTLVRRALPDIDDPRRELAWGHGRTDELLAHNPELQVHHMLDPNQDRLMARRVGYLRLKRRRLGSVYERFLEDTLEPGGTIVLIECGLEWPTSRVRDRHRFQFGAEGGIDADEYHRSGSRVADMLAREGSPRRRWDAPAPDGTSPEAEWGFEPALRDDVVRFAQQHGYRVCRLRFHRPDDLAAPVADLYRWWYAQRGWQPRRVVVESFFLVEPWWTLRTGSVPLWTTFPVEPSARAAASYLRSVDDYAHVHVTLFSHGVESVGLASLDRWRELIAQGRRGGGWLGVDTRRFPLDLSVYADHHDALRRLPDRLPLPEPLRLQDVERFFSARPDVQWRRIDRDDVVTTCQQTAPHIMRR